MIEAGFAVALLACLARRYWGYAAFLALALAEAYAALRYPFHFWMRVALVGEPPAGGERQVLQTTMLYLMGLAGLAVVLILLPPLARASHGRRLMMAGTGLVLSVFAVELISRHDIDAIIYHPAGPFTRVAIAYFAGAIAIALGAVLTPRRPRPTRRVDA